MKYCIVNGRLVPESEALVSVQDRGFRFGDGVFETIAVHDGVPYQFNWHMNRLQRGLSALRIDFPLEGLNRQCRTLLLQNVMTEGILRIQITRGIGSRGYLPDTAHPQSGPCQVIETAPLPVIPSEPVALWLSGFTRVSSAALPVQYKLCQGLNSILARMEAADHHCADALLVNERGELCETSSGNLFWLKEERLFTPSLSCGALEGSTRAALLRLSPYPVTEVQAPLTALHEAQAVFITNAVWQALPVGRLLPSDRLWNSAEVTSKFRRLLTEDRQKESKANAAFWRQA